MQQVSAARFRYRRHQEQGSGAGSAFLCGSTELFEDFLSYFFELLSGDVRYVFGYSLRSDGGVFFVEEDSLVSVYGFPDDLVYEVLCGTELSLGDSSGCVLHLVVAFGAFVEGGEGSGFCDSSEGFSGELSSCCSFEECSSDRVGVVLQVSLADGREWVDSCDNVSGSEFDEDGRFVYTVRYG
jgi:hypothetical protein